MITTNDVPWGQYRGFEGPYYHGSVKFRLSSNPTDAEKLLAVTTATEGGTLDAINAYDKCIFSAGLIQFCEARYFFVSKLLGHIVEHGASTDLLAPALEKAGATFQKDSSNRWRFFFNQLDEVNDLTEQQRLFLGNSNGKIGTWDDESRELAKLWVASVANFLAQPAAIKPQVNYTAVRMRTFFATKEAREVMFSDGGPDVGWVGAARAAFTSFAANLPAVAAKQLKEAMKTTSAPKWSKDWVIHLLQAMTFGPGIAIYPGRYNKIRPVIEKVYGVDLPDFSDELKIWKRSPGLEDTPVGEPDFTDLEEVQKFLRYDLGFDIGNFGPLHDGVDGRWGEKTEDAIITFQQLNMQGELGKFQPGVIDASTRKALLRAWRKRVC